MLGHKSEQSGESISWRAQQLTLHFSALSGMLYRTGVVRLGQGLTASLTPTLVLHVRTWGSAVLAWDQARLCPPRALFSCLPGQLLEVGGGEQLWMLGQEKRVQLVFVVFWGTDTWGWQAARSGRLRLPLQGHPLWPRNSSRVRAFSWFMEDSPILAWLGVDWVRS